MKDFFSRLNYSMANEDWRAEKEALRIDKTSDVLCITASGDRPLHLLLDDCRKITSVDANPAQNHLLKLKCAALKSLDFNEYLQFLGAKSGDDRELSFEKLLIHLDQGSATFWKRHHKKIKKGVIYQGDIERLAKLVSLIARLFRPKKIKKLFDMNDLKEQIEFVDKKWDTFLMRKTFDLLLSRFLSNLLAIDPGLYSNVDPSIQLGSYIYDRMLGTLKNGLAKENLLISLIFRGYLGEESFPPYLTRAGFDTIKERIPRLSITTEDAVSHLERVEKETYNRFSMSDIASYMDRKGFDRMIEHIYRAAKPGARFCIRQFSSNHQIDFKYAPHFIRERDLEEKLERQDSCFVYRFFVGEIQK